MSRLTLTPENRARLFESLLRCEHLSTSDESLIRTLLEHAPGVWTGVHREVWHRLGGRSANPRTSRRFLPVASPAGRLTAPGALQVDRREAVSLLDGSVEPKALAGFLSANAPFTGRAASGVTPPSEREVEPGLRLADFALESRVLEVGHATIWLFGDRDGLWALLESQPRGRDTIDFCFAVVVDPLAVSAVALGAQVGFPGVGVPGATCEQGVTTAPEIRLGPFRPLLRASGLGVDRAYSRVAFVLAADGGLLRRVLGPRWHHETALFPLHQVPEDLVDGFAEILPRAAVSGSASSGCCNRSGFPSDRAVNAHLVSARTARRDVPPRASNRGALAWTATASTPPIDGDLFVVFRPSTLTGRIASAILTAEIRSAFPASEVRSVILPPASPCCALRSPRDVVQSARSRTVAVPSHLFAPIDACLERLMLDEACDPILVVERGKSTIAPSLIAVASRHRLPVIAASGASFTERSPHRRAVATRDESA